MKFTIGYEVVRERLKKNANFSRSCFNCKYFYQADGDTEEVCQNRQVLEYDMIVDGNNIYCLKWSQFLGTEKVTEKKTGRDRLDDYSKEEITETGKERGKRLLKRKRSGS